MSPSTSSSPPPTPSLSATSTPTFAQRDIRRFLSIAMSITPPTPNVQPSTSDSNQGMDMETSAEDEESRKRRHSDDEDTADIRSPGQGSLLTNTSIPIRQRLNTMSASDPPTPDTIGQVMQEIRASSMQVTLPTMEEEDLLPDHNDHSTSANVNRVQDTVTGIVNLTRRVIHTETQEAMTWDPEDIGAPSLPMVSPLSRPNIASPPPARPVLTPNPISEATIIDTLKDSFKSFFDDAYKQFETKVLATVSEHDRLIVSQSQLIKENSDKINDNTTEISNIDSRISEVQREVESISRATDRSTNIVEGHIQRLDEGAQVVRDQLQLLQTLQDKVTELEAKVNQGPRNIPHREESNAGEPHLTPEELSKIRKKIQMDDDHYYFSTLQFKRFTPPRRGTDIRSRHEARQILKLIDGEDVVSTAKFIKFSADLTSLRLTFDNPKVCAETLSYLSGLCSHIKRSGHQPSLHFAQLTPPRFTEQRQALNSMAKKMKEDGEITRFSFTMRNQTLCLRTGRQGYPDKIIPFKPNEHVPMETDEDVTCLICLQDLAGGDIAYMDCKHVLHKLCLVTSLERSIGCPVCKVQTDLMADLKCQKCISDINEGVIDAGNPQDPIIADPEDPQLVLSRKCGHLHRYQCQALYMSTLQDQFPLTPVGTTDICQSNVPGCLSCQEAGQSQSANLHSTVLHNLTHTSRTRAYMPELNTDAQDIQPPPGQRQPQDRRVRFHSPGNRDQGRRDREIVTPPRQDRHYQGRRNRHRERESPSRQDRQRNDRRRQ